MNDYRIYSNSLIRYAEPQPLRAVADMTPWTHVEDTF